MTLPTGIRGRLVALGLLLVPLILVLHYVAWPLARSYLSAANDLEATHDEITRYQNLLNQAPALQNAIAELERTRPLAPYLIAGRNRSLAAAVLQRQLQDAAQQHGATILSLRVRESIAEGTLERISVEARLRTGTPELKNLLYFIETSTPYLFVEDLSINAAHARRRSRVSSQGDLDVRLTLYSLHAPEIPKVAEAGNG